MSKSDLFSIQGKTVVITGVSGLLGGNYAKAFLDHGARVAGIDLHDSDFSQNLRKTWPENYFFWSGDVTKKESLLEARTKIQQQFGVPEVLLNNAALDSPPSADARENGPFENYPEASWDKVLDVNLKGVYLCCQVFGPAMAEAGEGSIINVASIYGLVSPDQGLYEYRRRKGEEFYKPVAYAAAKSGVLNLTRYLAVYWARRGVRVNTLTLAGVRGDQDPAFHEAYCGRIPIGRMAKPDEYNGAVIFLASNASRYMTGSNLIMDGGWTAI